MTHARPLARLAAILAALWLALALPLLLHAQPRLEASVGRAPRDTTLQVPPWVFPLVTAPDGAYPVALCVTRDSLDTTDGLHIRIDSARVAKLPHHAVCNARPVVYIRPACGLLDGEREQFDDSRAEYLIVICDARQWRLLLRADSRRSTP